MTSLAIVSSFTYSEIRQHLFNSVHRKTEDIFFFPSIKQRLGKNIAVHTLSYNTPAANMFVRMCLCGRIVCT